MEHFYDALTEGKADAALAASLFHYKELEIREVKEYLREKGLIYCLQPILKRQRTKRIVEYGLGQFAI